MGFPSRSPPARGRRGADTTPPGALRGRAGAATGHHAIFSKLAEQDLRAWVRPRHPGSRGTSLPNGSRRCARPGSTPRPSVPSPREPHADGRDRDRPPRAARGQWPLRGGRMRLHRPPRGQPGRLQLPHRVLRVHGRAALRGLDEPTHHGAARAPPDAPVAVAPTRRTQMCDWRHTGLEHRRAGPPDALDDRHPLARLISRSALFEEDLGTPRSQFRPGSRRSTPGTR